MTPHSPYIGTLASESATDVRAAFIRRTYFHLAGAILAFILLEAALFQTEFPAAMMGLLGTSRFSWLIVLAAFVGVSWLAENWARSETSEGMQYMGLSVYVVAESILFVPLIYLAVLVAGPEALRTAALITLLLFTGLTFTALTTRKDFSFLGGMLKVGGFVALGVIAASIVFGFSLGLLFSAIMVIFAGASILYNTSNIQHRYRTTQHVAASLSLFASVALLFWYVLRIVMGMGRRS